MTPSFATPFQLVISPQLCIPPVPCAEESGHPPEESELLGFLNKMQDLSHGSDEILSRSLRPGHRWHVSPERANLLWPFRDLLHGEALELGRGAGAVVRFMAECGCRVRAIEPTSSLAALTRARCRDLDGVDVRVAGAGLLPADPVYDLIVATALPFSEPTRIDEFLGLLSRALKPGGVLILGIRNRLSLAAQAALDGEPGRWAAGKKTLETILSRAGLPHLRLLCALPDHETARLMLTPDPAETYPHGLEAILAACSHYGRSAEVEARGGSFWRAVLEDGLLPYACGGFVVAASSRELPAAAAPLVQIYSTHRRKHFARVTHIENTDGEVTVTRAPLFPTAAPPSDSDYRRCSYDEPYFRGTSYLLPLHIIMGRKGWQAEDIANWAAPWITFLCAQSTEEVFRPYIGGFEKVRVLPTNFLDCIPGNMLVAPDGTLQAFDFEYEAIAPIPLKFVVFRGLFYSLSAVVAAAPEAAGQEPRILDLLARSMRLCDMELSDAELRNYIETEARLQHAIVGVPAETIAVALHAATLGIDYRTATAPEPSPEPTTVVQVFWKSKDAAYSELHCRSAVIAAGSGPQTVTFALPEMDDPPHSLRLDPSNQPGVMHLSGIRLFTSAGECIWAWDGDRSRFTGMKRAVAFIDPPLGGSGCLLCSDTDDPAFEIPASPEILRQIQKGGRIEVDMSWPGSPEHLALTRSLLNHKKYQDRIFSLETENSAAASEIAACRQHIAELEGRETAHRERIVSLEERQTESRERMVSMEHERRALTAQIAALQRQIAEQEAASRERVSSLEKHSGLLTAEIAECQRQVAACSQANEQLQDRAERVSEEMERVCARLEAEKAKLQVELEDERRESASLSARTQRSERACDNMSHMRRELEEQLSTVKQHLKTVSAERDVLQQQIYMMTDMHSRLAQMPARVNELETQVSQLAQMSARVDELETRVSSIYSSRIWRTLVALSSPLNAVLRRRDA